MTRSTARKAAIKRGLSDADLRPLTASAFTALCLQLAADNRRARRHRVYHEQNLSVARKARLGAISPLTSVEG